INHLFHQNTMCLKLKYLNKLNLIFGFWLALGCNPDDGSIVRAVENLRSKIETARLWSHDVKH
ncbi:hypothetical protein KJ992_01185, partial [Patescibacteria group bacterium]|nr:hypothetical protein [Patescibacteria group bacterium]